MVQRGLWRICDPLLSRLLSVFFELVIQADCLLFFFNNLLLEKNSASGVDLFTLKFYLKGWLVGCVRLSVFQDVVGSFSKLVVEEPREVFYIIKPHGIGYLCDGCEGALHQIIPGGFHSSLANQARWTLTRNIFDLALELAFAHENFFG